MTEDCPRCKGTGKVEVIEPLDDDWEPGCEEEDWPRCGCRYCFCMDRTENGEPCDSCLAGAHQG